MEGEDVVKPFTPMENSLLRTCVEDMRMTFAQAAEMSGTRTEEECRIQYLKLEPDFRELSPELNQDEKKKELDQDDRARGSPPPPPPLPPRMDRIYQSLRRVLSDIFDEVEERSRGNR